jgi:aspartyl-tRNA(Asn)/glutamyl-tRNA(Gln) amidotransferase subunit C
VKKGEAILEFEASCATIVRKDHAQRKCERDQEDAPTMTAKVTLQDVERVAELAHLELAPDESQSMLHDLNAILDQVAQLNELDTSSVAPLSQVSELDGAGGESSLRQDAVLPSLDRAAVMHEAPETDNVFFKVPKVIER